MSTFLLEIGTEELPADFVRLALAQLHHLVSQDLKGLRLSHGSLETMGTPRRLALLVHDLPDAAADHRDDRKGPPASQAFRDGIPTPAAIGFAKRCGIDPEGLEIRETAKGPFVFASVVETGRASADLLVERIPAWIESLQGRRFMRWGVGEQRFSRPVRWLVAMLDSAVLPVQLQGADPVVIAGRSSRAHRLSPGPVELATPEAYVASLEARGVIVERERRRQWIAQAIAAAAASLQATPDLPETLLEELTDLVESPQLIQGDIDPAALALPAEVLSTVMRTHQRYVPLMALQANLDVLALRAEGGLLPSFLCIGNGLPQASTLVQRGNERVLRARLADAEFFLNADRAVASIDRRAQLQRVLFAEGLGSLLERVERLEWLTDVILDGLQMHDAAAVHARRAAHLCKHDLVSQMVGEFPELQGIIGGKYLLAEGEDRPVALAVLEHYLPRGAGDRLPSSDVGAVVAMADRLELLLSIFAKGERPSGSSDPYALRRSGNALLQILWDQNWVLDLQRLIRRAASHWATLLPNLQVETEDLVQDLNEFLRQRLVSLLEEAGNDADLVLAVAGETVSLARLLADPADARHRVELLMQLRQQQTLGAVQAVVTRAGRLADQGDLDRLITDPKGVVQAELFESPAETAMLSVLQQLQPITAATGNERYSRLAAGLSSSAETLARFFDGEDSVLVMADDQAVRRNRLNLLGILRNQASVLADFSRISG